MRISRSKPIWLAALCAAAIACAAGAVPAQAVEFDDPLFLFRPLRPEDPEAAKEPPPFGDFEGPCGLAVSSAGNFYVSDYYHYAVDIFGPSKAYGGQIAEPEPLADPATEDPVDGPCGLAFDAADNLYVNIYHRSVVKFSSGSLTGGTLLTGAPIDGTHPTGVAVDQATGTVYVNNRDRILRFDSVGAPLPAIGVGQIEDAYGLAVSLHPATAGRVYVPDAGTGTVKVFNPATDIVNPVAIIDGGDTPQGGFVSLRDAAVAVDRVSGEVYVADNLQPVDTERPEAVIDIFTAAGAYEGRLKYNIVDAKPPGLAVDNSAMPTQGRVYVTTENSERAAIFAYPPGAATDVALPALPLPRQMTGEPIGDEPWNEEPEEETAPTVAPAALAAAPAAPATLSAATQAAPAPKKAAHRRAGRRHRTKKHHVRSRASADRKSKRGDR